ncbi:N-acetyl sugar amidotransferase [Pseudomonadota bacterium]|nr:N-acetyl sugar amidotransferase [Pseudomonadota bacterium]
MKICTKCIYSEKVPGISFNDEGVCSYCLQIKDISATFKTGTEEGNEKFLDIVSEIKIKGKGKKYDVIIGVSGGTDSSYLLHLAIQLGLRPLAVHYDNTWNTAIATQNIKKMVTKLDVDLATHVIDNQEQDNIVLSFFKAGICGLDAATDLALAEVAYRYANKYKIKYVFEGHSFVAEGISPISTSYTDGKFIESVVKEHSGMKLKSYPLMTFFQFLRWTVLNRIKKIRPLWYIKYDKESARSILEKEYDWRYYGGHHLENRLAAFDHSYLMPTKFKVDQRNNSLSALVRDGRLSQAEALSEYAKPPVMEKGLVDYTKKRLKLSDDEFDSIMNGPIRHWSDYKTYKRRFEMLRPLFLILAKANLVPTSFYLKYCFPVKNIK